MSEFTFDIPATWKTQADRWAGLFGVPACIAGGALRDLDIGVPHKDVDKEAKEFRIRRCENRDQLDRSTLRGQRIIKRSYPGYDLVLPKMAELPLKEDL